MHVLPGGNGQAAGDPKAPWGVGGERSLTMSSDNLCGCFVVTEESGRATEHLLTVKNRRAKDRHASDSKDKLKSLILAQIERWRHA